MGAKKLPECAPKMPVKPKTPEVDSVVQKAEIERMKKLITEKIKDPALAKKAAMIITEMLNK